MLHCVAEGSADDRERGADPAHGDPARGAEAHPGLPAAEVCDLSPLGHVTRARAKA